MSDTIVSDTGTVPPFVAEHVGSLLRPAALLAARAEYEGGRITAEMLRETEDDCIRHAVVIQAELGLKGVTDGEFRRGSWHMDFLYQIGGVEKTQPCTNARWSASAGDFDRPLPVTTVICRCQGCWGARCWPQTRRYPANAGQNAR